MMLYHQTKFGKKKKKRIGGSGNPEWMQSDTWTKLQTNPERKQSDTWTKLQTDGRTDRWTNNKHQQ